MNTIPASDRIVTKSHNAPPKPVRTPDANHARLFLKIVKIVAIVTEQEAELIALKRQPDRIRFARMVSFWLATGCDESQAHIPQVELAAITGIYRKTIAEDIDTIRQWRERNLYFRDLTDMMADAIDPLIDVSRAAAELLDEATGEFDADRAARKALQTIRASVDKLDRPALKLVASA